MTATCACGSTTFVKLAPISDAQYAVRCATCGTIGRLTIGLNEDAFALMRDSHPIAAWIGANAQPRCDFRAAFRGCPE